MHTSPSPLGARGAGVQLALWPSFRFIFAASSHFFSAVAPPFAVQLPVSFRGTLVAFSVPRPALCGFAFFASAASQARRTHPTGCVTISSASGGRTRCDLFVTSRNCRRICLLGGLVLLCTESVGPGFSLAQVR
eukprot:4960042-Pleurochrysis_carterae.AAC.1